MHVRQKWDRVIPLAPKNKQRAPETLSEARE